MSGVLVLQHAEAEGLGTFAQVLRARGIKSRTVRMFAEDAIPRTLEGTQGLIVMGGPMGVYEQEAFPFLRDELALIEDALKHAQPVLGVCLGSQVLAAALGSRVYKGKKKEIGWHPVTLSDGSRRDSVWQGCQPVFVAFHWHGDVFDLPRGAVHLASSKLTPTQAFLHSSNAYGILFHIETTSELVEGMINAFPDELAEGGASPQDVLVGAACHLPGLRLLAERVFSRWCDLLEPR